MILRTRIAVTLALGLIGFALGCESPTAPRPQVAGLQIIPSRELSDTADHEPIRIQFVLADAELRPIAGAYIHPHIVAPLSGSWTSYPQDEHPAQAPYTDANGRASLYLRLGCGLGDGWLRVEAGFPGEPLPIWRDSIPVTAFAALAHEVRMPRDTAVYQGNSVTLRAEVRDKCEHPLPDTASLEALSGGMSVVGHVLTANAAPSRQLIRATAGTAVDSTYISIVPEGELSVKLDHIGGTFPSNTWGWALLSLDGSSITPLITRFSGLESDLTAEWIPGGQAVAFRNGDAIARMTVGGVLDTIAPPLGGGLRMHCPAFSADGGRLFVHIDDSGPSRTQIRQIALSPSDTNAVLTSMTSGKIDVCPSPSPDGQYVAYTSESSYITNPGGEFAGYELRFVNRQTLVVDRTFTLAYAAPRFSPDGSMLAAVGGSTLFVRSHPAGVRRDLATANYAQYLSWSPDSKWIIVERDGPVLELVNAETGLRLPLGFTGYMRYPSWRK